MKIKLLRNVKTQALLVYLKTVCQGYLEKDDYTLDIGNEVCNEKISTAIKFLEENLSLSVWNAYELSAFTQTYHRTNPKRELPYDYRALIFYYNNIINEFEGSFNPGDKWIPEQIILALLSEWIFEEEKSINEYPFLKEIDYFELLSYFEFARNNEKREDLKQGVNIMYKISSNVIRRLKNAKFKINNTRKSKTRN